MNHATLPRQVTHAMRCSEPAAPASRYSWYVLALLLAVYSFNWMDRYLLVILMESIKRDLGLSDAALGLLSGFAFAFKARATET